MSDSQRSETEEVNSEGAVTARGPAVVVDFASAGGSSGRTEVNNFFTVPRHTIETVIDGRRVLMVANEPETARNAKSAFAPEAAEEYKEEEENWPANRKVQELFPFAQYQFEPPRPKTPPAV